MLGDGHGVEAGHVGDPHPFVGGRLQIDVVDANSKLLDEAEAPCPDGPPGQRRPERDDDVDGRPGVGQPRFKLALSDDFNHGTAGKAGRPVLRHFGPGVILGEPLLTDQHPKRPGVRLVSTGGHASRGEIRSETRTRRRRVGGARARLNGYDTCHTMPV